MPAMTDPNITVPGKDQIECTTAAIEKMAKWKIFLVYATLTPRRLSTATAAAKMGPSVTARRATRHATSIVGIMPSTSGIR